MNNIFKISTLCLFFIACSEPQEQGPPVKLEPVQDRVVKKSLPYMDSQGKTHQYTLSLPENYSTQGDLPVVMYLHGNGGNENSELGVAHFIDNLLSECTTEYPLIVFPSDVNKLYIVDNNYHIAHGLLDQIAKDYSLSDAKKRIVVGFSNGAAAASRTPLVNPGSYSLSFAWSGWIWRKDTPLFEAVEKNAAQLKTLGYQAIYFTGDKDHPNAYEPLIPLLQTHGIKHTLTVFDNQTHDLGFYHRRTQSQFKEALCQVVASE